MTADKKQPPEGVLCLVRLAGDRGTDSYTARHNHGKWMLTGYGGVIAANVEDWRKMPSWDRLAILDRYDEERKEWTAHAKDGFDRADAALRECDRLRSQVTALAEERDQARAANDVVKYMLKTRTAEVEDALARADRAEKDREAWEHEFREAEEKVRAERYATDFHAEKRKEAEAERDRAIAERDEAREAWGRAESDACEWEEKAGVASADLATFTEKLHKAIAERDEALKRNRLGLSAYETVGDCSDWVEAVATGIGIYYEYDGPFVAAEARHVVDTIKRERAEHERLLLDAYLARDNAEAERDDLGCQLEALRAVQRGDVADLRTRMEAVEGRIDTIVGIKMARNDDEKGGA